jgi:hypothetical protein
MGLPWSSACGFCQPKAKGAWEFWPRGPRSGEAGRGRGLEAAESPVALSSISGQSNNIKILLQTHRRRSPTTPGLSMRLKDFCNPGVRPIRGGFLPDDCFPCCHLGYLSTSQTQ